MAGNLAKTTAMDILTDTMVWLIERGSTLFLQVGRWASRTVVGMLDFFSEKVVSGLNLVANLAEKAIQNPVRAATYLATAIIIVLLILAIEIYFYDLIKRRRPAVRQQSGVSGP